MGLAGDGACGGLIATSIVCVECYDQSRCGKRPKSAMRKEKSACFLLDAIRTAGPSETKLMVPLLDSLAGTLCIAKA
eukprot:scaffold189646_cov31-Prasinocladus_malaysianus.AAC.1